jgi:hypothetical protein
MPDRILMAGCQRDDAARRRSGSGRARNVVRYGFLKRTGMSCTQLVVAEQLSAAAARMLACERS